MPTVSLPHLEVIPHQRKHYSVDKGFLVCNSSCAVIRIVISFAALQREIGPVDQVSVVMMQAVLEQDILESVVWTSLIVVSCISGEEDMLETEA